MSVSLELPRRSAAGSNEHVAESEGVDAAEELLPQGPRVAFVVSGIAVALLFAGWVAFYILARTSTGGSFHRPWILRGRSARARFTA
jgi:hypothetical protein